MVGFIFYKIDDFLENYDDCLYLISISTFLVELYLDVVHKVRLVIGFEFLANKTCRYIPKEDSLKKVWWLINKWRWHYFFKHLKKERKKLEVLTTKKFIKDKMTGMVDILWRIVEIIAKKIKWSQDPNKAQVLNVFGVIYQKHCFSVPVN